ncbi:MAG: YraN family protein [Deltaproteobacteria bacterium]|nr:MAG: YraN family protein [Deltaproteobacteria bacterium]RLC12332.1 MAG: YraN family protein [Deltaproteobacteria bacterium]
MLRKRSLKTGNPPDDRRRHTGVSGESFAVEVLEKNGYQILEQNYRTSLGEIDIIAREGDVLVFVEVKSRRTGQFGSPKLAVTAKKQRKISMVALEYLKQTRQNGEKARFDVVSIRFVPEQPDVEIIKNAFELAY